MVVASGRRQRGRPPIHLPPLLALAKPLLLLLLLLMPRTAAMASGAGGATAPTAAAAAASPAPQAPAASATPMVAPDVLVLDVDGTLYDASTGLEAEIAARIKAYCNGAFGVSGEECDDLHRRYGSTIEGLRQQRKLKASELAAFYEGVYRGLPLHRLLPRPAAAMAEGGADGDGDVLGYAHRMPLRELLAAHAGPVWVASNSPSFHVHAVLRHLGLATFPFMGVLTPDSGGRKGGGQPYPTKMDPRFWEPLLKQHGGNRGAAGGMVLLDDSDANLAAAVQLGMRGVKVNGRDGLPLDRALAASLGAINAAPFDDVAYIRAKNAVDARSFCAPTARRLGKELAALREQAQAQTQQGDGVEPTMRVKDLGAGLLSMLAPVLRMAGHAGWARVEYEAYEVNPTLVAEVRAALVAQGFEADDNEEGVLVRGAQEEKEEGGASLPAARVRVLLRDFGAGGVAEAKEEHAPPPHLVVGCCLADLYQPDEFVARLLRVAGSSHSSSSSSSSRSGGGSGHSPLVYLPITFAGRTCLCPPAPEEDAAPGSGAVGCGRRIPSDATAMVAYHASLAETQGHCLDPNALVAALERHGAVLLAQGPADWAVARDRDPVLWHCLLHFFGLGLLPRLGPQGWDIPAWRRRVLARGPDIEVGNVDLLFRLGGAGAGAGGAGEVEAKGGTKGQGGHGKQNVYVEFVGPRDVRCEEEAWPPKGKERELGPMELEVEALCSLISSGTELKVYRGDFDRESAVDVSIKGMASERMDYPLRYGYSLVGRVVRCGAGITDPSAYMGPNRLVFCFAPHAAKVIVDASAAMPVPLGIAPEDAVYLPSMETALSLVQDARPVAGERVTVVGAGLIGLLVVSVLSQLHLTTLRAVDPLPTRRALARLMGATEATDPAALALAKGKGDGEEEEQQQADTSIEVSGVAAGLQTALDFTGYGGRVVVGSWYGNHEKPAALRLGLPFHRSHLRVQCSQVSRISTELQDRWSKARRFGVAWDLVRRLRPSRALTTLAVPPQRVAEAFEALDQRAVETLAVLIDYRMPQR